MAASPSSDRRSVPYMILVSRARHSLYGMPCLLATLMVAFFTLCCAFPTETGAETLPVGGPGPGGYVAIQDAIDAAGQGDTVLVYPGRYVERLRINLLDVHLISLDGPSSTIIDGAGSGPVIVCVGMSSNSSIQGFTITGGVTSWPLVGGGIYLASQASPLIADNIVVANMTRATASGASSVDFPHAPHAPLLCEPEPGSGGGIFVYLECRPVIVGNTIADNTAMRDGGGIVFWDHADAFCVGNRIYRNSAGRKGGGIYVGCNAMPTLEKNVLARNNSMFGGGIYLDDFEADATVRRNTLYMNAASSGAGGIQCGGPCRPTVQANLIAVAEGGGIACDPQSEPTVECNIVWGAGDDSYGDDCFPVGVGYADADNFIEEIDLCGADVGDFRPCLRTFPVECGPVGAEDSLCPRGACGLMRGSWGLIRSLYRGP